MIHATSLMGNGVPLPSLRLQKRLMALACAICLPTGAAWGLDLRQAFALAVEQDSTVRAARASAEAAQERIPQSQAQLLPNATFSAGRSHNDLDRSQAGGTDLKYTSHNTTLQVRQPIYRKQLWINLEQSRHVVADANLTLEREMQNLVVRVTKAYLDALLAQDQLDLVLAQQAFLTKQLDASRKALTAGSGTRTDIDEATARLDMNRAQELEANQHVDFTLRQLQALINQPVQQLSKLDPAQLSLKVPEPNHFQDWLDAAFENSPEIQTNLARVEAARLEVEKARAGHYPTLDATAQWTSSGSENVTAPTSTYKNLVFGVQLNVPLYSGGYVQSTVRQALAGQTRAEEVLEATRRDLSLRLHQEYRNVTEGILKIRALEQAVRSADQVVDSTRKSYAAGARTAVDILNAEQQHQSAKRDLAQARYAYLLAGARLRSLAGNDKMHTIENVNSTLALSIEKP